MDRCALISAKSLHRLEKGNNIITSGNHVSHLNYGKTLEKSCHDTFVVIIVATRGGGSKNSRD